MLIDWFTVGAQIVNFLVLMALLKIFLYDRVIQAMDAREQKITERIEDAERQRREAHEKREAVDAEKRSLEQERRELIDQAREDARAKREALEDQARAEVDELKRRWTEALEDRKQSLTEDVRQRALKESMALTRRIVKAMVDEDFRDRLVGTFANRIRELDAEAKGALTERLDADNPAAVVLSDAEMGTAQRQKITRLLRKEIHPDLEVDYRTDGDFLGGVELRVAGNKVSWNPQQYLADLEENILASMEAAAQPRKGRNRGEPQGETGEPHGG